jgi:DNA-binding transcriptional ArsR family regulator/rhodanese-related sulfurtransferase
MPDHQLSVPSQAKRATAPANPGVLDTPSITLNHLFDVNPNPKRELFGHIAELARPLGHAHRLELLEHFGQGERSVEALSQRTGLTLANASRHLQSLRRCGLVRSRRNGKRIIYSLTEGPLLDALAGLHRLAERNMVEVREIIATYFDKRDELDPISRDEVMKRLRDESVVLLDVRPQDEFSLGHLPGALNTPLADLERQLRTGPLTRKSSHTVVGRIVCSHSRRSPRCEAGASKRGD